MRKHIGRIADFPLTVAVLVLFFLAADAGAMIDGVTGPSFSFTAGADFISTAEGGSWLVWGYKDNQAAPPFNRAQYPGPTMIVNEGDTVTVTLTNTLPEPVSILFPGQTGVTATGGQPGLLTRESAGPADSVTYRFKASKPGTYVYYSGTHMELQVEMGLLGVLIVRPALGESYAYNHANTRFDREHLFLLTEMDPYVHLYVDFGAANLVNNTNRDPLYWFINGRVAPDDMLPSFVPWLPTQPYGSMAMMHPGDRLLIRVVNLGRDLHPFHTHGNHARVIARDGRLLESTPGAGPDLSFETFTINAVPGQTWDAIFEWTGEKLGWDIYGPVDTACADTDNNGFDDATGAFCHDAACTDLADNRTGARAPDGFDDATYEYCADHGKPLPVVLPALQDLALGGFYGGSPFLGDVPEGGLPPGQGGLNPTGAFVFMWHSHAEKELTNFDIFPGGMMTMLYVEAPGVPIP
ncbi:MAG: multicopper oxidase domain-containing protein [Deltaproteobacteria bacterium]|nr:multicopper oxidase domain-containing protein [Deltaproteobacteria bacterium]